MRLLVCSDIHSNATALAAALDAAKGRWERAVCLGDLVGYGPDPNEVVDSGRDLFSSIIRGNHDKAMSGVADLDDFNPAARTAALWTQAQLRKENRQYLRDLAVGPLQADGLVLVH